MTDTQYGAVVRPDWAEEIIRLRHPVDGSKIYTVPDHHVPGRRSRRDAQPLLLLHGVGNSGAIFGPLLPLLAHLGPIAAPTLSPELLTERGDERHDSISALVDWLGEVHPPPWRLVGHSMGGVLVGLILRTRPEVVTSAVLMNAPLPSIVKRIKRGDTFDRTGRALLAMKALARITSFGRPRMPAWLRGTELLVVRNALRGFAYDPGELDDEVINRAILRSRTTDGVDFLRLARFLPEWELEPFTGRPVGIVLGDADPMIPVSDFDAITAAYPQAAVSIAPTCGHFAHLERTQFTLDAIERLFTPTASVRSP